MPDNQKNLDLILSGLVEKAMAEGAEGLTLQALVEEASEAGARRALMQLGLSDNSAGLDIHELRALLTSWRDLKRSARHAAIGWLTKIMVTALLVGLVFELKLFRFLNI